LVKGLWRLAAKRVWVWLHDINPIRLPSAILDRIERVIVLSDFHKTTLDPTIVDKAVVIPNGINPHLYRNDGTVRYTHHYFYSSSPRRGLAKLLDQWPAVMAKDPFSQLHVAYGFGLPIRIAEKNEPHLVPMLQDLLVRVQTMDGVFYSDRIGQSALARLQMSCEAWLYPPNDFQEVHCITALEAQAAECVPVTRLGGALNTTVNNCLEWKEGMELVDLVEKIDCFSPQLLAENRAKALSTSWDAVAKQWQLLF
jgi:glycosyltransferase involved in cell wall biosynthesis